MLVYCDSVYVVQCLKDTGIHQFRLLFILAVISGVCFAPLWVIYDLRRILNDSSLVNIFLSISVMSFFSHSIAQFIFCGRKLTRYSQSCCIGNFFWGGEYESSRFL